MVSELRERLPELKPPPALEPEQARFRLFDSIATFLKNAGRRQPLVLILEDLHWADRPSLLLLEFVCRELSGSRLLVIGTYRDVEVARRHPLALTLAELTREQLFQRVLLRGLRQEDVGRFIELVAGVTPAAVLVGAVYRQTEGNPLFVTEVVRLLAQEGHLSSPLPALGEGPGVRAGAGQGEGASAWLGRIPEGIREVIGRRLDRLSERCNQVLTVASVIGREFTTAQVQPLVEDLPRLRLLEVLEEALAARVIEELPRAAGRYQFTHALIQETLVEELSTTRRVQMHAQIGAALEELYGGEAETHAAELAHHYGEAATECGPAKLVQYSLIAGERALGSHAFEEALAFFQRGLGAKEGSGPARTGPAEDAEAAALLFGLGRAQIATLPLHDVPKAVASLRRSFGYYEGVGDVARAVAVAEYPPPIVAGVVLGAAELAGRALALVPQSSPEAARLLSLRGRLLGLEAGDLQGAQEDLEQALQIARTAGDPALELRCLLDRAEVDLYHGDMIGGLERSLRAVDLSRQVDDPLAAVLAPYLASILLGFEGDPTAAEHASTALEAAERLGHHFYLARVFFGLSWIAMLNGQFADSRLYSDRGLGVSPREVRLLFLRAGLEFQLGEFELGEAYLERLLEETRLTPPGPSLAHATAVQTIGVAAVLTGNLGRVDTALDAARTVLSSGSATPINAVWAHHGLALLAIQRGDIDGARAAYAFLEHAAAAAQGILFAGFIDPRHLLALLAGAIGDSDGARRHFEDALSFCRRAGFRPLLARTCVDYAHMLLEQERSGGDGSDRAKATGLLDEGLQIARELGMKPLVERALRDKEFLSA